jgi:hypothetical protein
MSLDTDTFGAGSCQSWPALVLGTAAGERGPRLLIGQGSWWFPADSPGLPRGHRHRLEDAAREGTNGQGSPDFSEQAAFDTNLHTELSEQRPR